ncbi:MAG: hypothetical protein IBX47_09560 [Desulfuromonadales bacterium]|nr:hypothetical protein [Desulfuromonadales bacterium]
MLKKLFVALLVSLFAVVPSAFAALAAADLTAIQTGISGADANYYVIGGGILVVLAGIWGFKKLVGLLR